MTVAAAGADARASLESPESEKEPAESDAMTKTLRPRGTAFSASRSSLERSGTLVIGDVDRSIGKARRRLGRSLVETVAPCAPGRTSPLLAEIPGSRGSVGAMSGSVIGDNEEVSSYEMSGGKRRSRPPRGMKWAEVALPTCLVLAVSIPAMVLEEDWHGRPMIEQATHLWILPAFLVASAFLFGGARAGFRCPSTAVAHAFAAASFALVILLLGAEFRRLWIVHEGVPIAVVRLWCLGVIGALMLSLIGSLLGRRLATDR